MTERRARAGQRRPRGPRGLNLRVHKVAGLAAMAFLVVLAATGIVVNHAHQLGLDAAKVRQTWLLRLYFEPRPVDLHGYRVAGVALAWANGGLYIGARQVAEAAAPPVGAVAVRPGILVALPDSLLLFTRDGRLVERMDSAVSGARVRAVGTQGDAALLRTEAGCRRAGPALLSWESVACPQDVAWARSGPLPPEEAEAVRRRARWPEVPWSRLLLDLHSGRLFGPAGAYVVDILGVALVVLALTGFVNWRAARRRRRPPRA